jgi:hypothetical protein
LHTRLPPQGKIIEEAKEIGVFLKPNVGGKGGHAMNTENNEKKTNDPKEIILAINDLKSTMLKELQGRDPVWWKAIQLILPIVLTALFGFLVWKSQSSIQKKLDEKSSLLQAQLGCAQHLYEKRLAAYKELYDKVSNTYLSLQKVRINGPQAQGAKAELDKNLKILSELSMSTKFIASRKLNTFLFTLWYDTITRSQELKTEDILKKLVDQMRKDLIIDKLGPEELFKGG